MNIEELIRPNILAMKPYSSARSEYTGSEGIFLDANENPYGELNRYPDPYQSKLKTALSQLKNIPTENIFLGNGSDEVIDLCIRIFCTPGKHAIITLSPTYGMYQVSAQLNDVKNIEIPLNSIFQPNLPAIAPYLNSVTEARILFLCSPNNPTGNSLQHMETLIQQFSGIVVVDEAYIDFNPEASVLPLIQKYPNLIISQTMSKAWGHAAIRVGIAYASKQIISVMNKVKPPYNISKLNQEAAHKALQNKEMYNKSVSEILDQRALLSKALLKCKCVEMIYPSDSNFLLVKTTRATEIYNTLLEKKIITRNRDSVVKDCIRITVGTASENQRLIEEFSKLEA